VEIVNFEISLWEKEVNRVHGNDYGANLDSLKKSWTLTDIGSVVNSTLVKKSLRIINGWASVTYSASMLIFYSIERD
jgi:hypothetical protein